MKSKRIKKLKYFRNCTITIIGAIIVLLCIQLQTHGTIFSSVSAIFFSILGSISYYL
ncbi:hypothetical protein [uncultured Clostridium sp.]|uniref:hypothetical protein n=1 Tax=uncultured Clostridium sp. TaxID=59620 RepID=UPI00262D5089|nr:hypothetical protein [uncultured Clostridium sp.]